MWTVNFNDINDLNGWLFIPRGVSEEGSEGHACITTTHTHCMRIYVKVNQEERIIHKNMSINIWRGTPWLRPRMWWTAVVCGVDTTAGVTQGRKSSWVSEITNLIRFLRTGHFLLFPASSHLFLFLNNSRAGRVLMVASFATQIASEPTCDTILTNMRTLEFLDN